jgi:hypothetical protein
MGNDLILSATAVESMLAAGPASEQLDLPYAPKRLTPRAPYVVSAALVFGSPHVLSPNDDFAEFGVRGGNPQPPHPDAQVLVWFRRPQGQRTFNVTFLCAANAGGTFTLTSSVSPDSPLSQTTSGNTLISKSFKGYGSTSSWESFKVSCDVPWNFKSVEISELT